MKAILVINLPSNLDIPLKDIKTEITLSSKDVTKSLLYLKYGRVKLKPMPSKKVLDGNETDEIYGCYVGWNACIDEILGEEK